MSQTPGGPDEPEEPENPFKGTPFEAFFGGFPIGGVGGGPGGMPDLSQIFGQIQSLLQPYDGPLNWDVAMDLARKVAASTPDPTPSQRQKDAVADAIQLADHWLEETTSFPAGVKSATAWSKAEWLVNTLDAWKPLIEPVAASTASAMSGQLPEEMKAQMGPMIGFVGKAMGALYANQAGTGLGHLAGEVISVSDIGIPLAESGQAALLPVNVEPFAEGLGVSTDDVLLFLALREAAHQRLFAGVPWLRDHVVSAVTDYAQGVELNMETMQQRIEEQMRGLDLSAMQDPTQLQNMFEEGMFEVPDSPVQKAALERLEIVLALVEGWVDEVVALATADKMPVAAQLQEAVRRRRAAGGPAEQTFATLVGLELRPRRLRDAAALWGSLRTRQGVEARDGVWMSPALLPTSADLDDPLGFREGAEAPDVESIDFDEELKKLLGGDSDTRGDSEE
ncbi:zinc-dependent metalloprotease [Nocardioides panzhihuensis]|uniref:Putative hydrolase n=1 Tax=Nocardioides panzhihuensis TaxID=860243 RepID=A0A7Z0DP07_9ACTN|nr:zinc-dependent metalloprotease [Nocardioides panzhihuensis]NYI79154.1 putative hydrolase [Nocardioides panzhihuensis]